MGCVVVGAAYGWWHARTHATFEVQILYRSAPGVVSRMRNGQLTFLDEEGTVLSRATIDTRRGVVWLAHPELGQCGPTLERDAYLDCIRSHSEWIPQWAQRVRRANIELENCSFGQVPVTLFTRRDNAVAWWMPLPRASNRPFTRHIATITANQRKCGE